MSGKWLSEDWIKPISHKLYECFNDLDALRPNKHTIEVEKNWRHWNNDGDVLILASQVLQEEE